MQAKLTLSIDKKVIEKAKLFAKSTQRSLSEMVESYLEDITSPSDEILDLELSEIVGVIQLTKGFNEKEEIRNGECFKKCVSLQGLARVGLTEAVGRRKFDPGCG
ncbi:MAG: hypothetical protein IPL46_17125 [Saprospiraceae bacterium]|nr:hypothetical protein [Saprospiraceae bacterium]